MKKSILKKQLPWDIAELFAGIGCVTRGFSSTGSFNPVFLTDRDPDAATACATNSVPGRYAVCDVLDLDPDEVRSDLGGRRLAGLLGCPPCQGFSPAGPRDPNDPRNALLQSFTKFVGALSPLFFVIENVPGILDSPLYHSLIPSLRDYRMWSGVLNAALYGVPQTRQRALIIGYHRDLGLDPRPPEPTHLGSEPVFNYSTGQLEQPGLASAHGTLGVYAGIGHEARATSDASRFLIGKSGKTAPLVTVIEALGDLPSALHTDNQATYKPVVPSQYARSLRDASTRVSNHRAWNHTDGMVRRMKNVPEGGVPDELVGRHRERQYFSQAYGRLHRNGLARTLTTNFHNPGSGRYTHYKSHRTITVREAMRLQGIDDVFVLHGHRSTHERLVGNAFPVPLAKAIGKRIAKDLRRFES